VYCCLCCLRNLAMYVQPGEGRCGSGVAAWWEGWLTCVRVCCRLVVGFAGQAVVATVPVTALAWAAAAARRPWAPPRYVRAVCVGITQRRAALPPPAPGLCCAAATSTYLLCARPRPPSPCGCCSCVPLLAQMSIGGGGGCSCNLTAGCSNCSSSADANSNGTLADFATALQPAIDACPIGKLRCVAVRCVLCAEAGCSVLSPHCRARRT
jgi:hypothetical protein